MSFQFRILTQELIWLQQCAQSLKELFLTRMFIEQYIQLLTWRYQALEEILA